MILELATIDVNDSKGFEMAIEKAKKVISQSKGFLNIEVKKCIEKENRFILLISWETLEDHTIGFRESELFKDWRALIGPYFENPPLVQHYN
ncbi:MAG: antibiotic biosynthesis monooxygenase [Bacteroidota bacterium]